MRKQRPIVPLATFLQHRKPDLGQAPGSSMTSWQARAARALKHRPGQFGDTSLVDKLEIRAKKQRNEPFKSRTKTPKVKKYKNSSRHIKCLSKHSR